MEPAKNTTGGNEETEQHKSDKDEAKKRRFRELEKLLTKDIKIDNEIAEDLWEKEVLGMVTAKKAFEKLSKGQKISKNNNWSTI